jgi:hypothetical protein
LKYGNDSKKWPEWMLYLVKDEQKELNRCVRRDFEGYYNDEYMQISDDAVYNLEKAKDNPEMDFEQFGWEIQ